MIGVVGMASEALKQEEHIAHMVTGLGEAGILEQGRTWNVG